MKPSRPDLIPADPGALILSEGSDKETSLYQAESVSAQLYRLNWLIHAKVVEAKLCELRRAVSRELQDLLPRLKEQSSAEEYSDFVRSIAGAIHGINTALIDKAIAAHPELEGRIEAELTEFGEIR
jgi:hypothetical protein